MQPKENSPICEHCGFDETADNLPHQLPVGTLLQNQYLVGRVLGQGGFGITYIGWDQHLAVPVAIKEYFPGGIVHRHTQLGTAVQCETGETEKTFGKHKERFLKEARTLAKLSDIPEIVQIKNYFSENGTAYIVMEYVQGITLKTYLKQLGRPMTEPEILEIVEPVLRALQKVHDQQLIHRDISPDNIMLPSGGGVKLIDFGTVRYLEESGASKSTETVLKAGFAPMEQYNARGNVGTWTDVYALSATFYYLLTGKVPPDVHERMEEGEELTLLRQMPGLTEHLIRTLEQGMCLRSAGRIQTVEELYRKLYYGEELLINTAPMEPENAQPLTEAAEPEAVSESAWLPKRMIPGIAAAAVVLVAVSMLVPKKKPEKPVPAETAAVTEAQPTHTEPLTEEDILEIRYNYGISLLDAGMYEQAAESFRELGSYRDSEMACCYAQAAGQAEEHCYAQAALDYAKAGSFRDAREQSYKAWRHVPGRKTVSVQYGAEGEILIYAIHDNGTVMLDGQKTLNPESGPKDSLEIDPYRDLVSLSGCIGLKYDGTLVLPAETETGILPEDLERINRYRSQLTQWTDVVMLSADQNYNAVLGVRADGTVVAVGSGEHEKCRASQWENIVLISQGSDWVVGLRVDGTVAAVGNNRSHQCDVENWSGIIDIATGSGTTVGLHSNGTTVTVGANAHYPAFLTQSWWNIAELEDGPFGIQASGKVAAGFGDWEHKRSAVDSWTSVVSVTIHDRIAVGLRTDGTLVFAGADADMYPSAKSWAGIMLP